MADLDNTYYGEDVVDYINEALGSEELSNESGGSASATLNDVFGDDLLDETQSCSEWCAAVLDGLDGMEDEDLDAVVKFLHISDPHNYTDALAQVDTMLNEDEDIEFVALTGDMVRQGVSNEFKNYLAGYGDKLLICPGNHDTYDYGGQASILSFIKTYVTDESIVWGDTVGSSAYFYKDIVLSRRSKLRIISLDQYEISKVRYDGNYRTMYSQSQIDWLCARLKELSSNDFVIIMMHEPPVQSRTKADDEIVAMRPSSTPEPEKLFVSQHISWMCNRFDVDSTVADEPQLSLIPRIVRAWQHQEHMEYEYNNYNSNGYAGTADVAIDEDFSTKRPATFLCYLCGHLHTDVHYYLPDESNSEDVENGEDWSGQLMLDITAASSSAAYSTQDDLGGADSPWPRPSNTYTYRINEVTLDFANREITIDRIGAQNTANGRVRDTITFPFVRET